MKTHHALALLTMFLLTWLCSSCDKAKSSKASKTKLFLNDRVDGIVSCTSNGLYPTDSVMYMEGGGKDYRPSIINKNHPIIKIPEGMVWIPGGEFSMGGVNPVGMGDGGNQTMHDARPIHRVYVDGFC